MAIINCPSCSNKISDKSKVCSHCNFNFVAGVNAEGHSEEQMASKAKLARMKQRYSLQMQGMASVTLFLLGIFLWYFMGQQGMTKVSHFIELGIACVGAVWYLITRVRLIAFKRLQ